MSSDTKNIIEAALFSSHEPISVRKLSNLLEMEEKEVRSILDELKKDLDQQGRSFSLEKIGGGYMLRTRPQFGPYLQKLHHGRRPEHLPRASLEVLAIIAYKQPITRPQIEAIRGVDSSAPLQALIERGLVEMRGKLEAPGRPTLYGVTSRFMQHFGLATLKDLPKL